MRNIRKVVLGCIAALAAGCGSDVTATTESVTEELATAAPSTVTVEAQRPATVPSDFVATPNGWFHRSCVYEVGDDEEVRGDVIAKRDGQSFRRMTACARPHYDFTGREATAGARNAPPPAVNGWVASADATTVPVDYVSATWRVPQVPRTNTATVYFFPGLENRNAADLILQPVLGYRGADAGAEWVIYSWDCCPGNNTHHSRAIAVQPGETISGFAQGTNCNSTTGVCSNWQIRTSSANDSSTFNVTNFTESMTWVFGGVLEAYGVNSCSQYPGDNHITFNNVSVHSVAGNNLSPTWTNRLWGASPSCSASVSSTSSSATINWCVPRTCGSQCGSISDGCGGTLNCGPCTGCPSGKKCCEPNPGGGCGLCWPSGNPCP